MFDLVVQAFEDFAGNILQSMPPDIRARPVPKRIESIESVIQKFLLAGAEHGDCECRTQRDTAQLKSDENKLEMAVDDLVTALLQQCMISQTAPSPLILDDLGLLERPELPSPPQCRSALCISSH